MTVNGICKYLSIEEKYKGYMFVYKNGLKEHYKEDKLLFDICKYYEDNSCNYPKELVSIFNKSNAIIYKYLTVGNKIGLCEYPRNKNKEAA